LSEYDYIIAERYTVCYLAYAKALSDESYWVEKICGTVREPDYILHLDIDPEIAVERIMKTRGKAGYKEKREVMEKARNEYNNLLKDKPNCYYINASGTVSEVKQHIEKAISDILQNKEYPLEPLS
jgi:thymidylate kinase